MLGALLAAHAVTLWYPGWGDSALRYALAMLAGVLAVGLLGAMVEWALLRRMALAPELYQLVATFGLTLAMHDAMRWVFGPGEVFAPRFPGLKGSVEWMGEYFPVWQLVVVMGVGQLVGLGLHVLLERTRFGHQLRAAAQDRTMLAALGVNPGPLMLGAVALGCALAGLAGALQLPREPAHLQMDVQVVVETFVVVVTGGLGSLGGAALAALLIAMVHSFGVGLFPQATLVLIFVTMAVVLAVRPHGLLGRPLLVAVQERSPVFVSWPVTSRSAWRCWAGWAAAVVAWIVLGDDYVHALGADWFIYVLFGVSLQLMMSLGGLVSFGHAAFFALGAYGAALSHVHWQWTLPAALACGVVIAALASLVAGAVVVRSTGVYLAMMSLALAQVVWASATQWAALTGGDNGVIGLRLVSVEQPHGFLLLVAALGLGSVALLGRVSRSGMGWALQAVRDAPLRAAASGLPVLAIRYRVFVVSAALAGLAGGLFAAHKGAVFPTVASVATSVDVLLVVLLGGLHHRWGSVVGATVLVLVAAELGRDVEYWWGALGVVVMLLMALAPAGVLGAFGVWWQRRCARPDRMTARSAP